MYITRIPNRGSPPAILLREGYRQDGRVKTRTLANLSKLPPEAIELLRLYLKGHQLVPAAEAFDVIASLHHGHVEAVLLTMRRLGFASLLASRSSRARELVLALVAARILEPESKLATTRSWHVTSLPTTLGVADADADELYAAMDWLLQRQDRIEQKLAARHLHNDGLALYDPELQLFRGPPLSPGFTGPQSRRQERQAAGQLRPLGPGCRLTVDHPSAGTHYPRSVGEFQAWFRTDADCLGLLGVVVMARWLRLRGLRPRWWLAAGRWALQVLRVRRP